MKIWRLAYPPDIGPELNCIVHFCQVALKVRDPRRIIKRIFRWRAGGWGRFARAAILGHVDATFGTDRKTRGRIHHDGFMVQHRPWASSNKATNQTPGSLLLPGGQ